jgi:hypothetical protein
MEIHGDSSEVLAHSNQAATNFLESHDCPIQSIIKTKASLYARRRVNALVQIDYESALFGAFDALLQMPRHRSRKIAERILDAMKTLTDK